MLKVMMTVGLAAIVLGATVPAFAGSEAVVTCTLQINDKLVIEAWNIPKTAHYSMELSIHDSDGNKKVEKRWIADRRRDAHDDVFVAENRNNTLTIKKINDIGIGMNALSNQWACEYH